MQIHKDYLPDANTIIHLLVDDGTPESLDKRQKAQQLAAKVAAGEHEWHISTYIILEVCFVLQRYYKVPKDNIRHALIKLISAKGINCEKHKLMDALNIYADKNVDIADALLAVESSGNKYPVITWDSDFVKLPCESYKPEDLI